MHLEIKCMEKLENAWKICEKYWIFTNLEKWDTQNWFWGFEVVGWSCEQDPEDDI